MTKLYKFLFSLYPLHVKYKQDKDAMVVVLRKNKPKSALSGEEEQTINNIMEHFSSLEYFVLVKGW
jgi:hypothetical protein